MDYKGGASDDDVVDATVNPLNQTSLVTAGDIGENFGAFLVFVVFEHCKYSSCCATTRGVTGV